MCSQGLSFQRPHNQELPAPVQPTQLKAWPWVSLCRAAPACAKTCLLMRPRRWRAGEAGTEAAATNRLWGISCLLEARVGRLLHACWRSLGWQRGALSIEPCKAPSACSPLAPAVRCAAHFPSLQSRPPQGARGGAGGRHAHAARGRAAGGVRSDGKALLGGGDVQWVGWLLGGSNCLAFRVPCMHHVCPVQ